MIGKSIYLRDRSAFTGGSPQAVYEALWIQGRRERLRLRIIFTGAALLLGAQTVSVVFGIALALFVAGADALHHWWKRASTSMWRKGLTGEQRMSRLLRFTLEQRGYRVLHARVVPGHGKVDQLVVGPNGVFVIENQAWSPDTEIEEHSGKLFINGKSGHAMAEKLHDKALTVARLLSEHTETEIVTTAVVAVHGGRLRREITVHEVSLLRALRLPFWIRRRQAADYSREEIDAIARSAAHVLPIGNRIVAG